MSDTFEDRYRLGQFVARQIDNLVIRKNRWRLAAILGWITAIVLIIERQLT